MTEPLIWHPELSVIHETAAIGEGATIHAFCWIGPQVYIGSRTKVQAYTFIPEGVTIGADCFIGPRVTFMNDKHPPSDDWLYTVVGNHVSIGAGALILPGVTIGTGAVIGAGSIITQDVQPAQLWYGSPARWRDTVLR